MEGRHRPRVHHALPAQPEDLRLADHSAVDARSPDYLHPSRVRPLSEFRDGRASPDYGALGAADRASGPLFTLVAIFDRDYADADFSFRRADSEMAPRAGY